MHYFLSLIPIGTAVCLSYLPLAYLGTYCFSRPLPPGRAARRSLLYAALIYGAVALFVWLLPSLWWGNRIQHAFGGGFLAYFICYRIALDLALPVDRYTFFIIAVLIVTTLGVGNELMEFVVQTTTGHIFSPDATDTWLDLASNTIGLLLASLICRLRPPVRREQTRPSARLFRN